MLVDITFDKKEQTACLNFKIENLNSVLAKQETLAILTTMAADFYLDPELEVEDLDSFISQATEGDKNSLYFILHEDGLELELK